MKPFPTQLSGASFLASRQHALLADEPRVGKTGTAIIATDYNLEETILTVTTASGRPVWKRGFDNWSAFPRPNQVVNGSSFKLKADVPGVIVSWNMLGNPTIRAELLKRKWDRVLLDESHFAKNFENKRTQAAYGIPSEASLLTGGAVVGHAKGVWALSGTPLPHDPSDIYPMMRSLCWERLGPNPDKGWPNVINYQDFLHRYCVVRMKKISNFRKIPVVIGGRNLDELRERLAGFMLLRTQADVGIRPPVYETLPLIVSASALREIEGNVDAQEVLEYAKAGDTKKLEMHLGPLRRLTGEIKAHAVVEAVKEEFESGLDKIVLAYWHKDVGQILKDGLSKYGVVGIDGSTPPNIRGDMEQAFLTDPKARVFLGQIEAAGEAIDLSSAAELWFCETVFSPKSMKQMSMRITNHTQKRQAIVRVCVLEGSIDEALQEILIRLWSAIREVLK